MSGNGVGESAPFFYSIGKHFPLHKEGLITLMHKSKIGKRKRKT